MCQWRPLSVKALIPIEETMETWHGRPWLFGSRSEDAMNSWLHFLHGHILQTLPCDGEVGKILNVLVKIPNSGQHPLDVSCIFLVHIHVHLSLVLFPPCHLFLAPTFQSSLSQSDLVGLQLDLCLLWQRSAWGSLGSADMGYRCLVHRVRLPARRWTGWHHRWHRQGDVWHLWWGASCVSCGICGITSCKISSISATSHEAPLTVSVPVGLGACCPVDRLNWLEMMWLNSEILPCWFFTSWISCWIGRISWSDTASPGLFAVVMENSMVNNRWRLASTSSARDRRASSTSWRVGMLDLVFKGQTWRRRSRLLHGFLLEADTGLTCLWPINQLHFHGEEVISAKCWESRCCLTNQS